MTDRPLFAGETVAAGSTLLTVMDTSVLLAKIHLAQQLAQQMKVGDEATITVPGVADPVPAKVLLISPALDPGSTTVEIWLRVENKKGHAESWNAGACIDRGQAGTAGADRSFVRAADGAGWQQVRDGGGRGWRSAQQAGEHAGSRTMGVCRSPAD